MATPAGSQSADGAQENGYNTRMQVMGIFVIFAFSALSCMLPLIVKRFSWIPVPRPLLFFCHHLGTGVIIATCFVHLVPTAFTNLQDPRLPRFWTEQFPAMAGLIMMVGVLVIGAIEYVFASRHFGHSHQSELTELGPVVSTADSAAAETMPENGRPHAEDDVEEQGLKASAPEAQRQLMQCILLEAGILFHSIFIGMAIAFSTGTQFVVLLIAISFHQTFEGLALGSRIAGIENFDRKSLKPWFMALGYGITAPLGQAIGLAVHTTFDLESQTGLLMIGIANAFSSGLLIYAGLVQMFYEDFLSPQGQKKLRGRKAKASACIALVLGCVGMSVVGAWA